MGERTTLYIRNLPSDCDREAEAFFRDMPGYVACRVRTTKTNSSICFVDFKNEPDAADAMRKAQGQKMSPNDSEPMRVEFAKYAADSARGPFRRSLSPPRRIPPPPRSPPRRSPRRSSRRRSVSRSPRRRSPVRKSSRRRSTRRSRTPPRRSRSPARRSRTPPRRSRSPVRRSRSPVRRSRSPRPPSPPKALRSPPRKPRSPSRTPPAPNRSPPPRPRSPSSSSPPTPKKSRSRTPSKPVRSRVLSRTPPRPSHSPPPSPAKKSPSANRKGSLPSWPGMGNSVPDVSAAAAIMSGPYSVAYAKYLAKNLPGHDDLDRGILYVEGIPLDAKEREVSQIFRPFSGFRRLRLTTRESSRYPGLACFVEFETLYQATFVKTALKGYPFDPAKPDDPLIVSICDTDAKRLREDSDDGSRKRRRSRSR